MRKMKEAGASLLAVLVCSCSAALETAILEKMRSLDRMTNEQLAVYADQIHVPPVGPNGGLWYGENPFLFAVPDELENRELAEMGLVDVTAGPFRADASGETDSTRAIQAAVDFARDHQMACFFPEGTYLISDTIVCRQKLTVRPNGAIANGQAYPCVLLGSTKGSKPPEIVLAENSEGFTDPLKRKIVIHFLNSNTGREVKPELGPLYPQLNLSYNQFFKGIDIRIGAGNAGAIGLRMQAAEGSSIQDVTIDARHGDTGMLSAAGSGGSHHAITVLGGRIGIDTRGFPPNNQENEPGTQPGPTMAGITLIGQTETAFYNYSTGPLVGVGWRIKTSVEGPAIISRNARGDYYLAQFSLIDSVIEFEGRSEKSSLLGANQGAYLSNVYVRDASQLTDGVALQAGWSRVEEAVFPAKDSVYKGLYGTYEISQPILVDGKAREGLLSSISVGEEPPEDLLERHGWGVDFPNWENTGAANVKLYYGALGDGVNDDTRALQQAIDENEIVFLPKGLYRVSDTLKLRADTKLIGVWQSFSRITAYAPFGGLAEGDEDAKPVIATANSSEASTALAFLGIEVVREATEVQAEELGGKVPCYALLWQCGGDSLLRSSQIRRVLYQYPLVTKVGDRVEHLSWEGPYVKISGNGGGRWYNFFIHGSAHEDSDDYRHVLVEGTRNRLAFYHLHAQHGGGTAQVEFRDSSNFDVFGIKSESETRALEFNRCSNFRIIGHSGWASALSEDGLYVFRDCEDFLMACFGGFIRDRPGTKYSWKKHTSTPFTDYFPLVEFRGEERWEQSQYERPLLYKKGTPQF